MRGHLQVQLRRMLGILVGAKRPTSGVGKVCMLGLR